MPTQDICIFKSPTVILAADRITMILIGRGDDHPCRDCSDEYKKVSLSENDILEGILSHDPTLARLFRGASVLKDELHVMPLVFSRLLMLRFLDKDDSPHGDVTVTFHDLSVPCSFIKNVYLPFVRATAPILQHADVLIRRIGGAPFSVQASFRLQSKTHIPTKGSLARSIIAYFPEKALHAMTLSIASPGSIAEGVPFPFSGTTDFIQVLDADADEDLVARTVLELYFGKAGELFKGDPAKFMRANRIVAHDATLRSVSSITRTAVDYASGIAEARLNMEYSKMLGENMHIFSSIFEQLTKSRCGLFKRNAKEPVSEEEQDAEALSLLYRDIFGASLLHPYLDGFLPYCINALLPSVLQLPDCQ